MHPATTARAARRRLSQTDDCLKQRQEGAAKLVQLWSSLAQRYSVPLDKDDVVDIRTGKVVEDRGVVSSWDSTHQGSFMDFKTRKKRTAEEANRCASEVDDVDELDAFAQTKSEEDILTSPEGLKEKNKPYTMLPPSTPKKVAFVLSPYRSRRRVRKVIDSEDEASDNPPSSSPILSSSPIILPLELDSEDELGRWDPVQP
ncbi:hypothetical protein APHAL10511_007322 [Amanita phalloides]|nr:hypothetical protein APHAL10511_007322 [Amanita phalloides]